MKTMTFGAIALSHHDEHMVLHGIIEESAPHPAGKLKHSFNQKLI